MLLLPSRLVPALSLPLLLLTACSANPSAPGTSCTISTDCTSGQVCIDGRCTAGFDASTGVDADYAPTDVTALNIDPPTAALLVTNDTPNPEQPFSLTATLSDGTTVPAVGASFELDTITIGSIDVASGRFRANGVIGGIATVTATAASAPGFSATATVTVSLERTFVAEGVTPEAMGSFGTLTTDAARSASLVYPLDGAVMPQNVFPANLQWLNGAAGDVYRITLTKPHATVVAFVLHTGGGFQNNWLVDGTAWRALAQTDPDNNLTIAADRLELASGEAIAGTPISMRFARAALTGSVYYWDIQRGRIVRINDGTADRDEFMPSPPAGADGNQCVGCHTVSNSGRYMAGRLGGGENVGAVFDLTVDLTANPAPTVFPVVTTAPNSQHWWFSSWSPDDSRLVLTTDEAVSRSMVVIDPFSGTPVPITGSLPTNATHPSWAPDNSAIAYVTNVDSWGGVFTQGDVAILPFTGADTVGPASVIHAGSSLAGSTPAGTADSYPAWAPDSASIAFANGTGCRSEDQQAALYMMGRGGSDVVRLDAANGGTSTVDNFQPRFSPFETDEWFFLTFLSRRDYGNSLAGTRGTGFQQIWVTAIRRGTAAGTDPSSVAYWLPGQNTTSRNISAYWAPRPCRPDGESCTVGTECCGGDCRPDSTGALVCSPPPDDRCRERNETCSTSADCCDGLECFGNVCIEPPA